MVTVLSKDIREHFMNRYTNQERAAVKSVVVDLNAQYIKFIKALFPNTLDLIVKNHPQFEKVYDAYQDVFNALKEKTGRGSLMFWKTTVIRVITWTQLSPP